MATISIAERLRHCEVLGVPPNAPPAQLEHAYRRLARLWHPDRYHRDPHRYQQAQERMKAINAAHSWLQAHPVVAEPVPRAVYQAPPRPAAPAAIPKLAPDQRRLVLCGAIIGACLQAGTLQNVLIGAVLGTCMVLLMNTLAALVDEDLSAGLRGMTLAGCCGGLLIVVGGRILGLDVIAWFN